ncbi:MAG: ABC transporter ATP-binding protein, partial [Deltaproteobacteria bacterium]|nr:ABC transporter ATP-binding protein [Deltaproteobacteria bacterium]
DEILNLLKELNDEGQTIIMVTHNPDACRDTTRTIQVRDGSCYTN